MRISKSLLLAGAMTFLIALFLFYYLTNSSRPGEPFFSVLPGVQPDRIVLTPSEDPATAQNVTWRTDETVQEAWAEIAIATGAPRFGRNAQRRVAKTESLRVGASAGAVFTAHYHSVAFTDLIPDTTYAYRVGDGKHWSEWIHFRTASKEAKPFAFLYVGDAQNDIMSLWSRLIRAGYSKAPDARFIIHAGDLVNHAHDEGEWEEWFYAGSFIHRMIPSVPLPGNHEYLAYDRVDQMRNRRRLSVQWPFQFTLPENGPPGLEETCYYFDYQGVRMIALNSNREQEKQITWVDSVLTGNPNQWAIVSFHHPIYSASARRDNPELRAGWKPVFDKHKVDLALQGHDHSYARGRTPVGTDNVMEGANALDATTGTVYVVSVSGGKMYNLKPDGWKSYGVQRDRAAENTQLFQIIRVEGDTLHYEAYTAVGELYDAFDLVKGKEDQPNRFIERVDEAIDTRRFDNTIPYRVEGE